MVLAKASFMEEEEDLDLPGLSKKLKEWTHWLTLTPAKYTKEKMAKMILAKRPALLRLIFGGFSEPFPGPADRALKP